MRLLPVPVHQLFSRPVAAPPAFETHIMRLYPYGQPPNPGHNVETHDMRLRTPLSAPAIPVIM